MIKKIRLRMGTLMEDTLPVTVFTLNMDTIIKMDSLPDNVVIVENQPANHRSHDYSEMYIHLPDYMILGFEKILPSANVYKLIQNSPDDLPNTSKYFVTIADAISVAARIFDNREYANLVPAEHLKCDWLLVFHTIYQDNIVLANTNIKLVDKDICICHILAHRWCFDYMSDEAGSNFYLLRQYFNMTITFFKFWKKSNDAFEELLNVLCRCRKCEPAKIQDIIDKHLNSTNETDNDEQPHVDQTNATDSSNKNRIMPVAIIHGKDWTATICINALTCDIVTDDGVAILQNVSVGVCSISNIVMNLMNMAGYSHNEIDFEIVVDLNRFNLRSQ